AQILAEKPDKNLYTLPPSASVYEAVKIMADKNIGAIVVMEAGQIHGLITQRNYARRVILEGRSSKDTEVRQIMDAPGLYVRPDHTNEQCMALMTEKRLRHLLVLDQGKLVGLVSIGDLVKDIISEQQHVIEQLEHYVRYMFDSPLP